MDEGCEVLAQTTTWLDVHHTAVAQHLKVSPSGVETPDPDDRPRAEHDFFLAFEQLLRHYPVVEMYGRAQIDAMENYLSQASGIQVVDVSGDYWKVAQALCAMAGDDAPALPRYKLAQLVFSPHGDFLLLYHHHPCSPSPHACKLRCVANEVAALVLLGTRATPTPRQASPVKWAPGHSAEEWSSKRILDEAEGDFARRDGETRREQVARLLEVEATLPSALAGACRHLHNSMFSPLAVLDSYAESDAFPRDEGETLMAYIARLLDEASADAPLPTDLARACREYFAPLQVFELHADAFPRDEGETLIRTRRLRHCRRSSSSRY